MSQDYQHYHISSGKLSWYARHSSVLIDGQIYQCTASSYIGNAFPNAYTNEKVYIPCSGIEFGEFAGKCIIIKKALYGLCSSAERFHAHLADTLRSFGFTQTRFNNDVWIRLDESGEMCEYICKHVDYFMICSRNPQRVMDEICSVYLVKDSSKRPPSYCLGNDY